MLVAHAIARGRSESRGNADPGQALERHVGKKWPVAHRLEGGFSSVTRSYAGKGNVRYQW